MLVNTNPNQDMSDSSQCLSFDELIAYSENQLSERQLAEIKEHIDRCPLCSEAIEGVHTVSDKQNLRPIVRSLRQEIRTRTTQSHVKKQNLKIYYALAASLLLASSLLIYLFSQNPMEKEIFSKYFKPYPNTIPIVRGEEPVDQLKLAMIEYEFENYTETVLILDKFLKDDPENTTARFYSGVSNLCLDKPVQAINQLKKVVSSSSGESDLKNRAEWYLGLAYLKNQDVENAKALFKKIASKDQDYKQKSDEILEIIKKHVK